MRRMERDTVNAEDVDDREKVGDEVEGRRAGRTNNATEDETEAQSV